MSSRPVAELAASQTTVRSMSARSSGPTWPRRSHQPTMRLGERDANLARKLGPLQPFIAIFLQKCMG
jgi:hypothetical protein